MPRNDVPDSRTRRAGPPSMAKTSMQARIESVDAEAFVIPTDRPEADGTISWDHTTLVVADVAAGNQHGLGYTYADASSVRLIRTILAGVLVGQDAASSAGAMVRHGARRQEHRPAWHRGHGHCRGR